MRRSQVYMNLALVFIAILIIMTYAMLGVWFISELDNARVASASADWRNTALLLANRLVNSPNCLGFIKSAVLYTNSSDNTDLMVVDQVNPPSTIDEYKFDINRLTNCLLMDSPEFRLYFEIKIEDESGTLFEEHNLETELYKNPRTFQEVLIPVKIIKTDESISYGVVTVGLSVNMEYFEARII